MQGALAWLTMQHHMNYTWWVAVDSDSKTYRRHILAYSCAKWGMLSEALLAGGTTINTLAYFFVWRVQWCDKVPVRCDLHPMQLGDELNSPCAKQLLNDKPQVRRFVGAPHGDERAGTHETCNRNPFQLIVIKTWIPFLVNGWNKRGGLR